MSTQRTQGIYFPNLHGLRFCAAVAVLVHHTEHLKLLFGLPSAWQTSAVIAIVGKLGVVLFFVLSGFLITYLLLEEESATGNIALGRFYLRRALRIWPLYYVVVALALFVLPYTTLFARPDVGIEVIHQDLILKVALFSTLFANVVLANVGAVPFAALTWSVATEEQFYVIWPVLMRRIRNKIGLMLAIIACYLAGRYCLESGLLGHSAIVSEFGKFYSLFNIDCMAIGGLAAVLLHRKSKLLPLLVNLPVFATALGTTFILVVRGTTIPLLHYEAYSVLFAFVILNLTANYRLSRVMEFEPLIYLGRISYGLYLLHPIAIVAVIRLLMSLNLADNLILYPLALLTTIGIASVSFRYLESPFLRLKARYRTIRRSETVGA